MLNDDWNMTMRNQKCEMRNKKASFASLQEAFLGFFTQNKNYNNLNLCNILSVKPFGKF